MNFLINLFFIAHLLDHPFVSKSRRFAFPWWDLSRQERVLARRDENRDEEANANANDARRRGRTARARALPPAHPGHTCKMFEVASEA